MTEKDRMGGASGRTRGGLGAVAVRSRVEAVPGRGRAVEATIVLASAKRRHALAVGVDRIERMRVYG